MQKILLTPGPCMTTESVRQAGALADLNHRDPEFNELIRDTKNRLLSIYDGTKEGWTPFLMGGSGTLSLEAMLTSCVKTGPVLALENGYFSERAAEILDIYGIPYKALKFDWREPWVFERIAAELRKGYETVVGAHNETTTGRLNDIKRLACLCREYDTTCLIDAMSSFGVEEIDFENLDAVCSSSNKCLHGIPGVAFVLLSNRLVGRLEDVPRRSFYMSLPMYAGDTPPITAPVPAISAFRQALKEFPTFGVSARRADYIEKTAMMRERLAKRGFSTAIHVAETSCTLTTFSLPEGWSFDEWFAANLAEGFVLYGCKGELRDKFFQASVMGEVSLSQVAKWIEAVDRIQA